MIKMTSGKDREFIEAEMALEAAYAEQEAKEKDQPLSGRLFAETNGNGNDGKECIAEDVTEQEVVKAKDEREKQIQKWVGNIGAEESKYFKPKEQSWRW